MARILALLLPAVILGGCRNKDSNTGTVLVEDDEEAATYSLVLTLETPTVAAGNSVAYGLVLVGTDGSTLDAAGDIASDLEASLLADSTTLWPTVAGTHTLTASADVSGEMRTATATLEVSAADVSGLDLTLSDVSMPAGGALGFTLQAWDRYGNDISTGLATIEADSGDVSVSSSQVTGTLPGTYTLVATLEDTVDDEIFFLVPGAADAVLLALSSTELELYETTSATVTVTDAYGNATDDPWTLSTSGGGTTTISYNNVTFWEEGAYYVRVDVDDTSLYDEVGPITIDSTGPALEVTEPERGAWVEGESGTVSGTVTDDWTGVGSLTVNGGSVTVGSDGSFSTELAYEFGMNVIETEATDGDGNVSTDTRALLAGDFLEYGQNVDDGILVRIHEGPGGLDTLESLGEGLVSATDLDAMIPSPVYDYDEESCYTVLWWEVCVTWYSITLYVTNPTMGAVDLEIDPLATGILDTTFTVNDVNLDWSASGTVVGIGYSGSGDITVDSLDVVMGLEPYVSSNQIKVDVDSVDVSSTGFDFDWDSWLWDIIDYLGIPLDSYIEDYVEGALEDAVYDSVPGVIEDALQDLEIGYDFAVGDQTYSMDALPGDISVNTKGLTLELETAFTASEWVIDREGLGSLHADYSQPTWTGSPGTILAINNDFLNQVFYAFWGGGLLDMQLAGADMGLDLSELGDIVPITDLNITTEALLPPVVVPGTGSSLLDLQVGDLLLTIYNGPAEAGYEMIQVYVSAVVGLDLDANADSTALEAGLGDMELYFDVVVPEANTFGASDTEDLLEAIVPLILPSLTDALGEVPIPAIEGFTITGISVGLDGAESGFVTLGGDLSE